MYIEFPLSEYVTESTENPHNEHLSAVNFTSRFSSLEPITVPVPKRTHRTTEVEYLPPTTTEIPEGKDKSQFNAAVLGVVLNVVLVWIVVIGIYLKNKISAKRQRRREREPPSYSDVHLSSNSSFTSGVLNTGINPTFELHEMSESSAVEVASSLDDAPSFVSYQPSASNQISTENSVSEEPPSYVEIQEQSSHMTATNSKEEPPSYEEAILQRVMDESGS